MAVMTTTQVEAAAALVVALGRRGVRLVVINGRLKATPADVLTATDRTEISRHKAEVAALLTTERVPADGAPWNREHVEALLGRLCNRCAALFNAVPGARLPASFDSVIEAVDTACDARSWPALGAAMEQYEEAVWAIIVAVPPAVLAS